MTLSRARHRAGTEYPDVSIAVQVRSILLAFGFVLFTLPVSALEVQLNAPGIDKNSVEVLRGASLVLQARNNPEATTQDMVAAARADYGRMVSALYELGYYGGVVSIRVDKQEAYDISPIASPSVIQQIIIEVEAGPIFGFGTAQIEPFPPGVSKPEGFATGERAYSGVIGTATTAAIDGWRDLGHAKAQIGNQRIWADHRQSTLSADVTIIPGPRLRFGELNITNSGKVRPDRVREIAGLPTGEIFSPDELNRASDRLRRTGAFTSVVLEEAEEITSGDTLDIDASLTAAKPRRVGFGAEISSLEGLTISGFWLHRNLLGGAERLRFEGEIGGIGGDSGGVDYRAGVRFDRPATFTPETGFFVGALTEEANEPDYRERNIQIGGGLTHFFSDELSGELSLGYQYTEIDDALGSRTLGHILMPATLTYDNRDDPLDAKEGIYTQLEVTPFVGTSDEGEGARLYLDARGYRGFGEDERVVLAGRVLIGSILGADVRNVPSEMLFFSGGAGTVRGQPYQSLGIDLPGGLQIGGRSFLALSAELRNRLWGPWSVVGFADAGFVGADDFAQETGDWHSGAGFGARYDTGFGPIRVDLATPLDGDAGQDFELYIGIGQAF